jgi:next-to-BRCA1 protein 1
MLFVGGDQMTTEMSVPISRETPVQPGEEVDVAVELTAPSEHGRYLGYWRLTGPHGRRKFGQRVWCHIHVVDTSATMDSAAFENLQATLDEIERKKKALAATEADGDGEGADDGAQDGAHDGALDKMMPPAPTPSAPGFPIEASKDGTISEDISEDGSYVEVVSSEVLAEAKADAASTAVVTDPGPSQATNMLDTKGALRAMGFNDASLIEAVIAKNGADLDACVRDLAAAADWDPLLDDLEEMGFGNRELNRTLMLKNSGNVKRTVKDLVEA